MPNNRTPNVSVTEVRDDCIVFELTDSDVSMANALRRIMIAEVPTLAIEFVTFDENSTALKEEIIAHRLGLIPLYSMQPMARYNYAHACDCDEHCEKCAVVLSLDVGFEEKAEGKNLLDVAITSWDLKSQSPDVNPVHFWHEEEIALANELPSDEGIVIARIGPGQRLKFTAIARKGIGKEHAKWSPVATVALKCYPIVRLNEDILNEFNEEEKLGLVESCPKKVYDYDESSRKVIVDRPMDCIFCKECLYLLEEFRKRPEDPLAVSVEHCYERFTFTVETTGSLKAKDVVRSAFQELSEKINRLQKSIAHPDTIG